MRLAVELPDDRAAELRPGDSVAVNGCCLTVAALTGNCPEFDVIEETLKLTNLGMLDVGDSVNIERPLKTDGRLDGHFVQGHIDGIGRIADITSAGGERRFRIEAGKEFCGQCIWKGSVALDGISLTIAELGETGFTVAIIPHSLEVTNLKTRKVGDFVNLEADMVGKYVRKQLVMSQSPR